MVSLPSGTTPTFQACLNDTLATNSVGSNPGTAFCVIAITGRMAGLTVKSVDTALKSSLYCGERPGLEQLPLIMLANGLQRAKGSGLWLYGGSGSRLSPVGRGIRR